MKKNDIININITDIAEDGSGIGRFENMVVFVRGMLPGEFGEILIIKVTKSYAIGKLINLLKACDNRIEPPCCENFSKGCGGCTFCHFDYKGQLEYKHSRVVDCLERIGGLNNISEITHDIIPSKLTEGYRNKAIYPFRLDNNGNIVCGFYAAASHRIVPIKENGCGLENSVSGLIREFTVEYVQKSNYTVYNEENGIGFLRALMIRTNKYACLDDKILSSDANLLNSKCMVVLVVNGDDRDLPLLKEYAEALCVKFNFVVSVYVCFNNKSTNVVLNGELCLLKGEETIYDIIGDFNGAPLFDISPMSFYQVNPVQTERLYGAVYEFLPKNVGLIYDIYCGIGTIGLYLLSCLRRDGFLDEDSEKSGCVRLVGVEYVNDAVENARKNAVVNGFGGVSDFYQGDASAVTPIVLEKYGRPDVIILDPPRKGCDSDLIDTVLSACAENVIYVSCNPATLARDLKLLCKEKYRCVSVQPVDMFPQSGHVETVCLLSNRKPDSYVHLNLKMEDYYRIKDSKGGEADG